MREGFESQRKKMNRGFNALLNARNNGITESLIEKIDDYFDVAVEAIHKAAEKGELGKISADGVEPLAEEFGRVLAKKLMALSKEEKERLIHDPVAVFDFYNKILRDGGMSFRLKDEATEELRVRQNRLLELEKENAVLRQRDAELRKEAERLREERKKDLNAPRYGDDDLQSETERIRRQRERDNAEYRDTTSAGRDNEDLGDTRRTWKQWALSWVGMGNRR